MGFDRSWLECPEFKVFTDSQCQRIYSAALDVLEQVGVKIFHKEALSLLKDAGAWVEASTARIPSYMVEDAVRSAPKKIMVYTREGKPGMKLEGTSSFYGTGSDCPNILDSFTGEIRRFTAEDIAKAALITDALPNIDFQMSLGLISDKPVEVTDLYQFQQMVFNSSKPIVFTSHDLRGNKDIFEMASIIAGNKQELVQHPFIVHYIEPSSPLRHSKDAVDKLLFSSESGIPLIYTPCPSGGATAPVTLAGNIVLTLAESLSGVVISQLKRRGSPVIIGGVITIMDMRTTAYCYGAAEFHLMSAALAQMSHYLRLPMFGTAGCSDSKCVDNQAAMEATLSISMQALSGANLIHDVGYIGSGLIGSYDMLVMCDEIIGMAKRFMEGISTEDEELAVELIHSVGPGGNFLAEEHTLKHFKTQHWHPLLMDRSEHRRWSNAGSKTLAQRTNDKVKKILEEHQPGPLDQKKKTAAAGLIQKEEKSRKLGEE
ncbi:MAG: trimethylamine methyltransferase family protein [Spirochaetota bacterium]